MSQLKPKRSSADHCSSIHLITLILESPLLSNLLIVQTLQVAHQPIIFSPLALRGPTVDLHINLMLNKQISLAL